MNFLEKNFSLAELVRNARDHEGFNYLMSVYVGKNLSQQKRFAEDVEKCRKGLKKWLECHSFDCDEAGDFCEADAPEYFDDYLFLKDLAFYDKGERAYYANIFAFYYPSEFFYMWE